MLQLSIFDAVTDEPIGIINWFAVHATSLNSSNVLISGDNKGLASVMMEKETNGSLVCAFASSNAGDASPNVGGVNCRSRKSHVCVAKGMGEDMFHSAHIIAQKHAEKAKLMLNRRGIALEGPIKTAHQWMDAAAAGCKPALGFSFGAGTVDGIGETFFKQGSTYEDANPFWKAVVGFVREPSLEQKRCHSPKPILLDTGEVKKTLIMTSALP